MSDVLSGLEYEFVWVGLFTTIVIGAVSGWVGVFLVSRRMSLLGDATGHATLPGLAAGFLLAGTRSPMALLGGALITGVAAALTFRWLAAQTRVRRDAAVAASLAFWFAVGAVLLSVVQREAPASYGGLKSYLFGNAAGISPDQSALVIGASAVVFVISLLLHRLLTTWAFDPTFARAIGWPVGVAELVLVVALALSTVVSVASVGVVLVAAMLVIPSSAALLLARRVEGALGLSSLLGAISGAIGSTLSFTFRGVATGPAMVVVAAFFFAIALVVARTREVMTSPRHAAREAV